jgi:hypothetical protein
VAASSIATAQPAVLTFPAVASRYTYVCGFSVSGSGTSNVGPIEIASVGFATIRYLVPVDSVAAPMQLQQTFTPCLRAATVNTAFTLNAVSTAGAAGDTVELNIWGYQQ